jgi:hypothetical protein
VIQSGPRAAEPVGRRRLLALALAAAASGACAAFRREPLEVLPGHQPVLGEVSLSGFGEPRVLIDIAREDGGYRRELPVDAARSPFVLVLPRGRYQVTRLRPNESGRTYSDETVYPIGVEFEVGDAAVYVGTLRLERVVFVRQLRVLVRDDYERTVPTLRERYPELPSAIVRGLMRPV